MSEIFTYIMESLFSVLSGFYTFAIILGWRAAKHFNKQENSRKIIRYAKFSRSAVITIKWLFRKEGEKAFDDLTYMIALTAFTLQDYPCFLKNITKLKTMDSQKKFWLALYYITVCRDIITAETYYGSLLASPNNLSYEGSMLLQGVLYCEEGDFKKAENVLQQIFPHLEMIASRRIATVYLMKCENVE